MVAVYVNKYPVLVITNESESVLKKKKKRNESQNTDFKPVDRHKVNKHVTSRSSEVTLTNLLTNRQTDRHTGVYIEFLRN